MTEITQADHDAAEEHFDVWYPDTAWGYDPLVEAFARHREAERARIVAWLRVNGLPVACIKHAQVLIDADNFWSVVSAIERGEHLT